MSRGIYEEGATSRQDLLLNEFINLAVKRFKWSNLPKGLTTDRLEEMLISHGQLGAFKVDGTNEITILPMFGEGKVNVYNEHLTYRLHGFNGTTYSKSCDEVVRLKNNPTCTDDISTLELYAKRIDDIEQTQEVNLFQMCIPKMIATSKDGILTAKNIIKKVQQFKFVILTRDKGVQSQIKKDDILDTSSPFLLDKLSDYENFYRNKAMSFLAINNANTDKKERLITSEVNANNDLINDILDMMYECRIEFCEGVKETFGHDIQVEKREVDYGTVHADDKTADREQG